MAQQDYSAIQSKDPEVCAQLELAFASSLPRRNISCVRQLLDESKFFFPTLELIKFMEVSAVMIYNFVVTVG